jgi:hypothetical protein
MPNIFANYGFTDINLNNPTTFPVGVAFPKILLTSSGYAFPDCVACNFAGVKSICYNEDDKLIMSEYELAWYKSMAIQTDLFNMCCMSMDFKLPTGIKYDIGAMSFPLLMPCVAFPYEHIALIALETIEPDHLLHDFLLNTAHEAFGTLLEAALACNQAKTADSGNPTAVHAPVSGKIVPPASLRSKIGGAMAGLSSGSIPRDTASGWFGCNDTPLAVLTNQLIASNQTNQHATPDSSLVGTNDTAFHAHKVWYKHFFAVAKPDPTMAAAILSDQCLKFLCSKKDNRSKSLQGLIRMFMAHFCILTNTQHLAVKLVISVTTPGWAVY